MFCKYRHILGKEREGIHSIRLFDIAIIDVVLTIVGGVLLAYVFKWNVLITILILFIIGVLVHRLFCVNSTINMWFFGKV